MGRSAQEILALLKQPPQKQERNIKEKKIYLSGTNLETGVVARHSLPRKELEPQQAVVERLRESQELQREPKKEIKWLKAGTKPKPKPKTMTKKEQDRFMKQFMASREKADKQATQAYLKFAHT